MKKNILLLFFIIASSTNCYGHYTKISTWKNTAQDQGLLMEILREALIITQPEYGGYQINSSIDMPQNRALLQLENGRLDLAHFVATEKRENRAIAVKIPLMQKILGYRLCLITEGNQKKFNNINSKQQWIDKGLTIGQHHNWPDTDILKANGIEVKTTYKTNLLFQQLAKNHFDCFARGINEISSEQRAHASLNLAIEKNIILYYPLPQFFFVSPKKPLLVERLTIGLTKLKEKGILQQIFNFYYQNLWQDLNVKNRIFINLHNPTLSLETTELLKDFIHKED